MCKDCEMLVFSEVRIVPNGKMLDTDTANGRYGYLYLVPSKCIDSFSTGKVVTGKGRLARTFV